MAQRVRAVAVWTADPESPLPGALDLPPVAELAGDCTADVPETTGDSPAMLFQSSGTTGEPKAALLTQRAMVTCAYANATKAAALEIRTGDVHVPVLPPHHVFAFVGFQLALSYGLTLACARNPRTIVAVLAHYHPHFLFAVPMMLDALAKQARSPRAQAAGLTLQGMLGGSVRSVVSGGAPLPGHLRDAYAEQGVTLLNGYGMTEFGGAISCQQWLDAVPSVGQPFDARFLQLRTVDGELQVKGPTLFSGYVRNGELDTSVLDDGWFSTGDLAHLDEFGLLHLTGRTKNTIILDNGENVSPEQIEEELGEFPAVAESIVAAAPLGANGREVLAVTVVPDESLADAAPGAPATSLRLRGDVPQAVIDAVEAVNADAPGNRVIRVVRVAPADVPRTAVGKLRRGELPWD